MKALQACLKLSAKQVPKKRPASIYRNHIKQKSSDPKDKSDIGGNLKPNENPFSAENWEKEKQEHEKTKGDDSSSFAEMSPDKGGSDSDDDMEGQIALNDAEAQKKVEVNEDGILNLKI